MPKTCIKKHTFTYLSIVLNVKTILSILAISSFATVVVTLMFICIPAGFRLKAIMDQVDSDEFTDGPMGRLLRSIREYSYLNVLFFDLADLEKYARKDDRVRKIVDRIKRARRILKVSVPIMVLTFTILLTTEK